MEHQFKVGDRVKIVRLVRGSERFKQYVGQEHEVVGLGSENYVWLPMENKTLWGPDEVELVGPLKPIFAPKFLLRADRASSPEEFSTLADVRKRVKELLTDSSVKRDSFKVYEIKSVLKVKIDERVSISSK